MFRLVFLFYLFSAQLKQKFYKTMSELKPEVETVLKTGRLIVERKQVDFPDSLSKQLDAIKQLYNELGAQVLFHSTDWCTERRTVKQ